jgi:hypothetical protein
MYTVLVASANIVHSACGLSEYLSESSIIFICRGAPCTADVHSDGGLSEYLSDTQRFVLFVGEPQGRTADVHSVRGLSENVR